MIVTDKSNAVENRNDKSYSTESRNKINSNEASAEEILSWVRSVRVFKSRARKSECQDIRNMMNVIMN